MAHKSRSTAVAPPLFSRNRALFSLLRIPIVLATLILGGLAIFT